MSRRTSQSFRRRLHSREPRRRFVIFCEGKNTEPAYFYEVRQLYPDALIDVDIVPKVGVAMTVAQKAIAYAKAHGLTKFGRKKLSSFEENDQVWAVFDHDNQPNYHEARKLCQQADIGFAGSNPCFELWLILHEEVYDKPDGHTAVQKYLAEIRPEYDPDGSKICDFSELLSKIVEAEKRALTQLSNREKQEDSFGRPSTCVGKLTSSIRLAAKKYTESK